MLGSRAWQVWQAGGRLQLGTMQPAGWSLCATTTLLVRQCCVRAAGLMQADRTGRVAPRLQDTQGRYSDKRGNVWPRREAVSLTHRHPPMQPGGESSACNALPYSPGCPSAWKSPSPKIMRPYASDTLHGGGGGVAKNTPLLTVVMCPMYQTTAPNVDTMPLWPLDEPALCYCKLLVPTPSDAYPPCPQPAPLAPCPPFLPPLKY